MSTLAEVLDAVRSLPIQEQRELFIKLRDVLIKGGVAVKQNEEDDWLPPNFTERLTDAFNEARRTAIQSGTK